MGIFDFLNTCQGDFIPLQSSEDVYGPGPCIIMYAVPSRMDDEELRDMVEDGMPNVGGVVIRRVDAIDLDDEGMDMMNTYNILANEIYEETNGVHWPACAKVVEPVMKKSVRVRVKW